MEGPSPSAVEAGPAEDIEGACPGVSAAIIEPGAPAEATGAAPGATAADVWAVPASAGSEVAPACHIHNASLPCVPPPDKHVLCHSIFPHVLQPPLFAH